MIFLDETLDRPTLECLAIDANMDLDAIEAATDSELLAMLRAYVEAGDECAAA